MPDHVTRRRAIGVLAAAGEVAAAGWRFFTAAEAAQVEALTAQIIPTTESPGAREAGVVHFIDGALAGWEADKREAYRTGLAAAEGLRRKLFPQSTGFAAMTGDEVRQVVSAMEGTPFFELLRSHTAMGFLSAPAHGGNRGGVGWAHIGFEHRMGYQPPFGYYDGEGRE